MEQTFLKNYIEDLVYNDKEFTIDDQEKLSSLCNSESNLDLASMYIQDIIQKGQEITDLTNHEDSTGDLQALQNREQNSETESEHIDVDYGDINIAVIESPIQTLFLYNGQANIEPQKQTT